ncbi:hypothetical protein BD311DRAFT_78839 [Dichomitus squalens]|uniref:Uncharacterized protein n=1 Tax=Dichomitus squalens TaxID=114155 RepID=A0A4Q9MX10_9APHY|nr:hypothetical protein BD311DRAFT_78839 [Dichomitus squalens]
MATAKPATTPLPRLTACTAGWLRGACFPPICCGRRARGRTRSLCIVQWRTGSVCEERSCQARGARFCVCSGACNPTAEWDQPFQPTQQSYIPTRHQDDLLALIYLLVSLRPGQFGSTYTPEVSAVFDCHDAVFYLAQTVRCATYQWIQECQSRGVSEITVNAVPFDRGVLCSCGQDVYITS